MYTPAIIGSCKYCLPVDNLPGSIINLTFGHKFNKPIDNLPNSIVNLTIGFYFNQLIKKIPIELKIVNVKKIDIISKQLNLIKKKSNLNIKIISKSILEINPNIQIIEF